MADVLGTASAALGIFDSVIQLIVKLREASAPVKEIPGLLEQYEVEVTQTKQCLNLVTAEVSLQFPGLEQPIAKLTKLAESLKTALEELSVGNNWMQQFWQQLRAGTSNRKFIDNVITDMSFAKLDMIVRVQLSLVGTSGNIRDAVEMSVDAIKTMDKKLEPLGTSIPKLIMLLETHRDDNGKIIVSKEDLNKLLERQRFKLEYGPESGTSTPSRPNKTIRGNTFFPESLSVTAPLIGGHSDPWRDANLAFENNQVKGWALGHAQNIIQALEIMAKSRVEIEKARSSKERDTGDETDNSSIYSGSTTSILREWGERYEAEIAASLVSSLSQILNDAEGVGRVSDALPRYLDAFARKLDAEQQQRISQDIVSHVRKHQVAISSRFQEKADKFVATKGRNENTDENEDEAIPPELGTYLKVVTKSAAYDWLLSKLHQELLFYVPGETNAHDMISSEILSHPIFLPVWRNSGPPYCSILYETDWDPLAFFSEQKYQDEDYQYSYAEAFSRVLTLTGIPDEAEGLSCGEYICRTWPQSGKAFIQLMEMHLASEDVRERRVTLQDGTELSVSPNRSRVSFGVAGQPDTVIEIGEQIAWVSCAMRSSVNPKCVSFRPMVLQTMTTEQTENSLRLVMQLRCQEQPVTESQQEYASGECWCQLFRNPVIVQGFPIPRRVQAKIGLEVDLATMGLLARGHRVSTSNGCLIIKGYRTMLVAVEAVGDMILWHVLTEEKKADIEYHDERVQGLDPLIDSMMTWSQIKSMRHAVGWCSQLRNHTEGTEASFKLPSGSCLEGPGLRFALEKISIGFTKYVGASLSLLATHETPLRLGNHDGYQDQISSMASQYVVLFDVHTRRGWLLDGATVLLHAVRSSLLHNKNKGLQPLQSTLNVLFDSRLENGEITSSAVKFLTDMHQMSLELYNLPDERKIETKTPLQRSQPTLKADVTEARTTTCYRVKDRVIRIYSVLNEIFSFHKKATFIKNTALTQLEGLEYRDMVKMASIVSPKYINLKAEGTGWVDLIRALHAVTFFGSGFGDILEPASSLTNNSSSTEPSAPQNPCKLWMTVPHDYEFLATTISTLKDILKDSGGMLDDQLTTGQPWSLAHGIYMDSPDRVFESCKCENAAANGGKAGKPEQSCDRVLTALREPLIGKRPFRPLRHLPAQGAVIFGLRRDRDLRKKVSGDLVDDKAKTGPEDEAASSQSNAAGSSTTASRMDPSTITNTQPSAISSGDSPLGLPATRKSGQISAGDPSDSTTAGGKRGKGNFKGAKDEKMEAAERPSKWRRLGRTRRQG